MGINLRSGDAVHWLRVEGVLDEQYDVVALPGVRRPMALDFRTDEIRRVLSIEGKCRVAVPTPHRTPPTSRAVCRKPSVAPRRCQGKITLSGDSHPGSVVVVSTRCGEARATQRGPDNLISAL
jgi:hypothetical protein